VVWTGRGVTEKRSRCEQPAGDSVTYVVEPTKS
jgi:hypothetical protein